MSKSTISTFQLFEMFPDQETARTYLEGRLWPNGPRCPVCGLGERITARAGRGTVGKTPVLGMRERGGRTVAMPITGTDAQTIQDAILQNVQVGSTIHTDEAGAYVGVAGLSFDHDTVNHSQGEYVRDGVTT